MNNFIRLSNKLLLTTTLVFGVGASISQFNRARAAIMTDCPNVKGTIGTGVGCDEVIQEYICSNCQMGTTTTGVAACCTYVKKEYFCVTGGVRRSLGTKEFYQGANTLEKCQYLNEMQDGCDPPRGTL